MSMDRKRAGVVVAVVGAAVLVLSAFADQFGYGDEGFGWLQTLGTVLGAAALVLGFAAIFWRRHEHEMSPQT